MAKKPAQTNSFSRIKPVKKAYLKHNLLNIMEMLCTETGCSIVN